MHPSRSSKGNKGGQVYTFDKNNSFVIPVIFFRKYLSRTNISLNRLLACDTADSPTQLL